jgi:uncharacterized protein YndB with AHSA1/START domain
MRIDRTVNIDAEPERVWSVMSDIPRWPEWTRSVTKVEPLQPGPLTAGGAWRISQPRFGSRTWHVTAIDPGRSFTWEAARPGVRMVATHTIAPEGRGSAVTLSVDSSGWAVAMFGWLLAGSGRRFVDMEAEGLKRRAESG